MSLVGKVLNRLGRTISSGAQKIALTLTWLVGLYYWISPAYHHEQRAVLAGIRRHSSEGKSSASGSTVLRRNIHRIEKGLIMRPRRSVFAKDYIAETVLAYSREIKRQAQMGEKSQELMWANDVLHEYFRVVGSHQRVDAARADFESIGLRLQVGERRPVQRSFAPALSVTYESLLGLALRRRSIRHYLDHKVDRTVIDQALVVAGYSPSACNRQPFHFMIFDNQAQINAIAGISYGAKDFADGFAGLVVVVGELGQFFHERDRHVPFIDASLAAMSFMFALETLGVSSCVINWPSIPENEKRLQKMLNLRSDQQCIMMLSYGVADPEGLVPYSQKKELQYIRTYNRPTNGPQETRSQENLD